MVPQGWTWVMIGLVGWTPSAPESSAASLVRSPVGEGGGTVDEEAHPVDVAEPPVLLRLVRLDDRVPVRLEVRRGVAVRRVVAAADVAAGHAHPQVHPLPTGAKTVLAPVTAWSDVAHLVEVSAPVDCGHAETVIPSPAM